MKQTFEIEHNATTPYETYQIRNAIDIYNEIKGTPKLTHITVTEITEPTNICEWCEKQPVEHRVCNHCLQSTQSR